MGKFKKDFSVDDSFEMTEQDRLVYLAAPYSHSSEIVREQRFKVINRVAGGLMNKGLFIFSPVSHGHPISKAAALPGDWLYWRGYCSLMIKRCTELYVLMLAGWEESIGVKAEIEIARELGIDVTYIYPDEFI